MEFINDELVVPVPAADLSRINMSGLKIAIDKVAEEQANVCRVR